MSWVRDDFEINKSIVYFSLEKCLPFCQCFFFLVVFRFVKKEKYPLGPGFVKYQYSWKMFSDFLELKTTATYNIYMYKLSETN